MTDLALVPTRRRALLRQALAEGRFRTQAELVTHLRSHGHDVSQPCVSRDLRDVGARKVDGRYRLAPAPMDSPPGFSTLVESYGPAGPHLVVIRTPPGGAQRVAHAIDQGNWPEAAGTVAGDDTIFIAADTPGGQLGILERLRTAVGAAGGAS